MSAGRKHAGKRQSARPKKNPSKTGSPAAPRQISPTLAGAQEALDECIGAVCLVEVTLHSLMSQEIASPEQEVLKRALKTIWHVQNWMGGLRLNDLTGRSTRRGDKS
jgi:hypothetical protein